MYRLQLQELGTLCDKVKSSLHDKDIVLLRGDLGSGKTTFVQAFVSQENSTKHKQSVTSPTFSIAQSYESASFKEIHHYDLYRKSLQEMFELGLLDMLERNGIHFVEWGDERLERILKDSGFKCMVINISTNGDTREYEVEL